MVQPPFVDHYTRYARGRRSAARWVLGVAAVWAALVVGLIVRGPRQTDALGNPLPRVPLDLCGPLVLLVPCVGVALFGRHLARQARDLGEAPFTVKVGQHPLRLGAEATLQVETSELRPRTRIVVSLECEERWRRRTKGLRAGALERVPADRAGGRERKRDQKVWQQLLEVPSVAVDGWPLRATFTVPADAPPSDGFVAWSIRVVPDEGAEVEQPLEVLAP